MIGSAVSNNCDPLSENLYRVRGNFIRTGRFLLKHQGVAGGLHCIILNYEARLCLL